MKEMYGDQFGEFVCGYWGLKVLKKICSLLKGRSLAIWGFVVYIIFGIKIVERHAFFLPFLCTIAQPFLQNFRLLQNRTPVAASEPK